jgi:hypothetical protein
MVDGASAAATGVPEEETTTRSMVPEARMPQRFSEAVVGNEGGRRGRKRAEGRRPVWVETSAQQREWGLGVGRFCTEAEMSRNMEKGCPS